MQYQRFPFPCPQYVMHQGEYAWQHTSQSSYVDAGLGEMLRAILVINDVSIGWSKKWKTENP